jgi:hypothetical protein
MVTISKARHKAEANSWYLLATLHGVPRRNIADTRQSDNRRDWNRLLAERLPDERKVYLIKNGLVPDGDLEPLSEQEWEDLLKLLAKRGGDPSIIINRSNPKRVDFSNVEFDDGFNAAKFLFIGATFRGARFSTDADFDGAIFCAGPYVMDFEGATDRGGRRRRSRTAGRGDSRKAGKRDTVDRGADEGACPTPRRMDPQVRISRRLPDHHRPARAGAERARGDSGGSRRLCGCSTY